MKNKNRDVFDIEKINHIDIARQIDNTWKEDSVLAFTNKNKKLFYAIRFRNCDKSIIKKKFINELETDSARRHNKKVINLIFAYMIFRLLIKNKSLIDYVLICPDHRPTKEVHHYIQKLSIKFGISKLTEQINIKFINRRKYNIKKRTPAHNFARKVLKGKKKAHELTKKEELIDILSKLL